MPQINLLGQDSKQFSGSFSKGPVYIARLCVFLFIVLLVGWGYLFITTRAVLTKTDTVQSEIIEKQKKILANTNRQTLLTRQGQLKAADGLIAQHAYWSNLLPELARVTLRTASYLSVSADSAGNARLSVTVPSYKEFDQYLQVFDLPDFSKQFSKVTVSSVGKYQQGDVQSVRFDVALQYNTQFLKTVPGTAPVGDTSPASSPSAATAQ